MHCTVNGAFGVWAGGFDTWVSIIGIIGKEEVLCVVMYHHCIFDFRLEMSGLFTADGLSPYEVPIFITKCQYDHHVLIFIPKGQFYHQVLILC